MANAQAYDESGANYGVYYWPNAASFLPNEQQATTETGIVGTTILGGTAKPVTSNFLDSITSSIGSLAGSMAAENTTQTNSSNSPSENNCSTFDIGCHVSSGISQFYNWIEDGLGSFTTRIGVAILGFILVAAGLYMFRPQER